MSEFSIGETPGGGMRGRRGWGGGSPAGIATTSNFGINYNDMLGKKVEVAGNYNFTDRNTINNRYRVRDYVGTETGLRYIENSQEEDEEQIHRFNFRLQYNMNENNRFLITPSLTLSNTSGLTNRVAQTTDNSGLLSESVNRNFNENTSLNFSNNILYSHRFGTSGRILTTSFNTSYSNADGETYLTENTDNLEDPERNTRRNQFTDLSRENLNWSGNVDYSQKLGDNSRLQLEYSIDNRANDSDRRTYDFVENTGQYSDFNSTLSNTFKSDYITQAVGPSYQYRTDKTRLQFNLRYQYATLSSDSEFPRPYSLDRNFSNLLPSAEWEVKFSKSKNLNISFRSNTNEPSVQQLQNVLDISNPLQLYVGNPALDQEYQNRFNIRYRSFDPENYKVFFVGVFGSASQNYITNSVYTNGAPEEFTAGYELQPGARLSRPVNLDGY
ncbi:MAG: outer membrane beta-barrel family protein, partial [Pontibacter sp.]|nr:outer membrane beta-barrel family protein [Pontibacter sp.]